MIYKYLTIFLFATSLFAQTNINEVKKLYEEYEYEKVIQLSSSLINDNQIPDSIKVEIFFMRAVSFFAIGNENQARLNYENLLNINKNFSPDATKLSPKILTFFDEVKKEFIKKQEEKIYSPENLERLKQLSQQNELALKYAMLKNIFLPGWGQVSLNNPNKGYALMGFSLVTLSAMSYYFFDTNKKETDYINEIDKNLIQQKYNKYNDSYKKRNILISTLAITWIYAQLDLLLNDKYKMPNDLSSLTIYLNEQKKLMFAIKIDL